ncbi:uroporphyrinogen decarboxylase family protein [Psychrobacillus sp. OK032]|uniref:uroporphyrinogen decarboxylase family protein n=1 Tax=Psychrobacillus sp. OK032 TaxID=1884358 RepID=UPI0008BF4860|nr:uroporphyrinogen decarboxylase family protein [Psychrobacillus sp. OK032]SES30602.1 uroporphyrinogen decarboxylase [Psychrobacillus sp. OK032]
MRQWTKKDRFNAILSGEQADRPIVIGWRHFIEVENRPLMSAKAQVAFTNKFDWDIVKFTPRATYYSEVWGNEYDYNDYEAIVPRMIKPAVQSVEDLWKIDERNGSAVPLAEQIEAIRSIKELEPERPIVQTVFSPLSVLLFLSGHLPFANGSLYGSSNPIPIKELLSGEGIHHALRAISLTLADYVKELGRAGADGIFYSTMGTAHPAILDDDAFIEFSQQYDTIVLEANETKKTILHTCGANSQPNRFLHYPIHGISWDTEATGNPDLSASFNKVKVCGVNQQLFAENNIQEIEKQAKNALALMKNKPFILAPNCSIPNNATDEALKAFRSSLQD